MSRPSRSSDHDRHDDPKYSRLFVIGAKGSSEEDLKECFSRFGEVEFVNIKKDFDTNTPKGMSYIKFAKTSAAAAALEAMNHQVIGSDPRPIKVVIAGSKGTSGAPRQDINPTRVFICVPKTMAVEELKEIFSAYGEVEHASLVYDKGTSEPKGLAFVNFVKFVDAARAVEDCDSSYRAVFATPKEERQKYAEERSGRDRGSGPGANAMLNQMARPIGNCCRLKVLFNPSVSKDMFWSLFNIVPGMVSCDLVEMTRDGAVSCVVYNNPQSAAHAFERVNGFEYPTGSFLQIKMDDEGGMRMGGGPGVNVPGHVQSLISTIKEATDALKGTGFASVLGDVGAVGNFSRGGVDAGAPMAGAGVSDAQKVCSAKLPERQPCLAENTRCDERLFFVLKAAHDVPNPAVITDVFCRFGNLIDAVCIRGKKCGYARYGNKESAANAMRALDGEDLLGSKLKIEVADDERGAKKRRMD